jgi:rubrerythrin
MPFDEIVCKGCGSHVLNKWCSNCDFKKCVKEKGITYCFECKAFPCKKIADFSKTRPPRTLGLRNLEKLRETKIEEWLSQQEKRWSCNECGKLLHWYSERCPTCGAEFKPATREASL